MKQEVIISTGLERHLVDAIAAVKPDRLFVLCDETTAALCLPKISGYDCIKDAKVITIAAGDTNKNIEAIAHVWQELQNGGGTRHSMMINLGGGMVTDLGGFAASTFKRGIHFVNIPTTLLSLVDASVGGKTGINFGGLKNEIGVFNTSDVVILDTVFLETMDGENMCSGYAEMLKHGLIHSEGMNIEGYDTTESMLGELLRFDIGNPDLAELQRMVAASVQVKERVVEIDPLEHGLRKALNLGHTVGHAFESYAMKHKPVLHGYAVAYGIICELYLSCVKTGFPQDVMRQVVNYIKEYYGKMTITCDDYPALFELMTHDKKNVAGIINFTLLSGIGKIEINQTATREEIYEALDFYREC